MRQDLVSKYIKGEKIISLKLAQIKATSLEVFKEIQWIQELLESRIGQSLL